MASLGSRTDERALQLGRALVALVLLTGSSSVAHAQPPLERSCLSGTWRVRDSPVDERFVLDVEGRVSMLVGMLEVGTARYELDSVERPSSFTIGDLSTLGFNLPGGLRYPIRQLDGRRLVFEHPLARRTVVWDRVPGTRFFASFHTTDAGGFGHGFVQLEMLGGGYTEVLALGFYPKLGTGSVGESSSDVTGAIVLDNVPGHLVNEWQGRYIEPSGGLTRIEVNGHDFTNLLRVFDRWGRRRGESMTYNLFRRNCTEFLIEVANAIRTPALRVPGASINTPTLFVRALRAENPDRVVRTVEAMYTDPVTPPCFGKR